MSRALAVAALWLALAGCRTRPIETVTTRSCVTHTREAIALADVGAISDFGTGQARISVTLRLRSCDAEADAGATVGSDGRVHVHAAVWRSTADCGATRSVERAIVVPAGRFDFVDDTSGNDLGTLILGDLGKPTGSCDARLEGADCTDDCQCQATDPALRCLGFLGNHGICARGCAVDRDCVDPLRPRCTTETSVPFVCYSAGSDCCSADSCGAGSTCNGCTCHPIGAAGGACKCDADCASGICSDGT
ncbi:MAG TPA: hypothetical protein VF334_19715, partial [Polyangia bacterium]